MQEIRHVAIGRFQRNIYKELDSLPFIITKDGKDYCVVTRPRSAETPVEIKGKPLTTASLKEETQDALPQYKCQAPNVNCRNLGYRYRLTFYETEGLAGRVLYLCSFHLKKAQETCEEITQI